MQVFTCSGLFFSVQYWYVSLSEGSFPYDASSPRVCAHHLEFPANRHNVIKACLKLVISHNIFVHQTPP